LDVYDSDDDTTLLINNASVTLTDTWAQYTASSISPTSSGFCRVVLKALDGSTTGDIGVDDISIVAYSTTYTYNCDDGQYHQIQFPILDEPSRNTDPGEANVKNLTAYKILNVNKTGSYVPTGFGIVSSVASDDYSADYTQQITITADITGSPTDAVCVVNGRPVPMSNSSGTTWTTGAIYAGASFGACTSQSIKVLAYKTSEIPIEGTGANTLTVGAISAKTATLISEISASLTSGGYTSAVTLLDEKEIGDTTPTIKSKIQIVYTTASPTVTMIDEIRTVILGAEAGWSNVSSCLEYSAVITAGTSVTLKYKVEHT
jgi:hypothetical protein